MKIVIKPNAEKAIKAVALYIESKNVIGSSENWVNNIIDFVISHAQPNSKYALCKHKKLAQRGLSCITFEKSG